MSFGVSLLPSVPIHANVERGEVKKEYRIRSTKKVLTVYSPPPSLSFPVSKKLVYLITIFAGGEFFLKTARQEGIEQISVVRFIIALKGITYHFDDEGKKT